MAQENEFKEVKEVPVINKKISKVFISVFAGILVVPTLTWGVLGLFPEAMTKINFSTNENRNMKEFPSTFNPSTFTSEVESWYNDNIPFRSIIYTSANSVSNSIEKGFRDGVKPFFNSIFHPITTDDLLSSYNQGYADGYVAGKNDGEILGYQSGYQDGKIAEHNPAYEEGYTNGNQIGYQDGYNKGYEEGLSSEYGSSCAHMFAAGKITESPSCTKYGTFERTCIKCGYTSKESIEKIEHYSIQLNKKEPTCEEDGHEIGTVCSICGEITSGGETIPKLGHTGVRIDAESKDISCEAGGYDVCLCSRCHEKYTIYYEPGHDGEFVKTVSPSYKDYGYDLYKCKRCNTYYRTNIKNKLIDTSYCPPTTYGGGVVIEGRDTSWLFSDGEDDLQYYQRTNPWDKVSGVGYWAQTLSDLCKSKGIQLVVVIVPNKEDVYSEYMPTYTVNNVESRGTVLTNYLKNSTSVNAIYLADVLKENKKYYQTYYKVDTHWTDAGAYIGVNEIYKAYGLDYIGINNIKMTEVEGVNPSYCDRIYMGGLDKKDYTDTSYNIDYKGYYSYTGKQISEGNITIIGDSFRDALIPFFQKDFDNCYDYHRRDELGNAYFNELIKNDILNSKYLVVECIERQDYQLNKNFQKLIDLLK